MFYDFWKKYEKRPLTGRNIILSSYCPQLYGMYIVKLAVSLVLTGGVSRNDSSGTRGRGESHLLLVGDPGTGKSQFLKYANKIIPKSILTTGIGSSSAGLTATASRVFININLNALNFKKNYLILGRWHLAFGSRYFDIKQFIQEFILSLMNYFFLRRISSC